MNLCSLLFLLCHIFVFPSTTLISVNRCHFLQCDTMYNCEARLPYLLHSWHTDGGEVVSITLLSATVYPPPRFLLLIESSVYPPPRFLLLIESSVYPPPRSLQLIESSVYPPPRFLLLIESVYNPPRFLLLI
jgi:hypothetical protein